jgi:hypothetical protein
VFDSTTEDNYELDSSGQVWKNGSAISINQCTPGQTITFVQIAAKNGVAYGLDRYGTVHFYGGSLGNCWSSVGGGNKNGFAVSIATDNQSGSPVSVWASDTSGAIWGAE